MTQTCQICKSPKGEIKTYKSDLDGVFKAHPECMGDIGELPSVEQMDSVQA